MFEEIQGKNLSENNPLLKPLLKSKKIKRVRFSITEILPIQLPQCREIDVNGEYGHLHSKNCKNYEQLDGCELYNRAHMLAIIFSTPLSLYIKYNVK